MRSFVRQSLILSAITSALLYSNYLQAELPSQEQPQEEHVVKGSRQSDQTLLQQKAEEIRSTAKELQAGIQKVNYSNDGQSFFRLANSPQASLVSFPISCHWLNWSSADSRLIQLEDGSTWEVAASDAYTIYSWRNDDAIFISPITSWFYSYDYYITNRSNNSYVKANLVDGPITFGMLSHWIVNIDAYQGHVYLENQTVWCVDPSDVYILRDWAPNDHIIMALHDSRYSSYDQVLINVNMDNQVHVKQY